MRKNSRFLNGNFKQSEIWEIRQQVPVGSVFVADYRNSYGIDANIICDMSDCFIEIVWERADEEGVDFDTEFSKMDNPEEWYCLYLDTAYALTH